MRDVLQTFSERLSDLIFEKKEALKNENGIKATQGYISEAIGINPGSLSKYLNAKAEPGATTLHTISDYFDVSVDYLLGKTEVKKLDFDFNASISYLGISESIGKEYLYRKEINDYKEHSLPSSMAIDYSVEYSDKFICNIINLPATDIYYKVMHTIKYEIIKRISKVILFAYLSGEEPSNKVPTNNKYYSEVTLVNSYIKDIADIKSTFPNAPISNGSKPFEQSFSQMMKVLFGTDDRLIKFDKFDTMESFGECYTKTVNEILFAADLNQEVEMFFRENQMSEFVPYVSKIILDPTVDELCDMIG